MSYADEVRTIADGFDYDLCEECGLDLDRHIIAPDPLGHAHVTCIVLERLEYLRGEIKAERISYGEIAELQSLASHIDADDVELLQWAGVPEK